MNARKLLFVLGVLSPAMLLALLGISGRFLTLPWQTPEYGQSVQNDILAYRQAVNEVWAIKKLPVVSDDQLVQVANTWIEGHREGLLKAIPPGNYDDLGSAGVRTQIDQSKNALLSRILRRADEYREKGDYDTATQFLTQAMLVSEVGKYSTPENTSLSAFAQVKSLQLVELWYPDLSPETKALVANVLPELRPDPLRIEHNYHHIEVLTQVDPLASSSAASSPNLLTLVASTDKLAYADMDLTSDKLVVLNSFRRAYKADAKLIEALNKMTAKLNEKSEPLIQQPAQELQEQKREMTLVVAQN